MVNISQIEVNGMIYDIYDATIRNHITTNDNISFSINSNEWNFNQNGDTRLVPSRLDTTIVPSSDVWIRQDVYNTSDIRVGSVATGRLADARIRQELYAHNPNANVSNALGLTVADDGTRSIYVSEAAPWRTALGLGGLATKLNLALTRDAPIVKGKNTSQIAKNANATITVTTTTPANCYVVGIACCTSNNQYMISRGFNIDDFVAGTCTIRTYWRNVGTAAIAANAATVTVQIVYVQVANVN